jgi:aryl-alcohol dehydrogenase-like predicted oxidoreductase
MGVQVPVTLQPQYSLLSREIEWELSRPRCTTGLAAAVVAPGGRFLIA